MAQDPFVWQRADQPTLAHILYHNRGFGYHAWGPVAGPGAWLSSPTAAHAFTLNATRQDGSVLRLLRRERPELFFAADGSPQALVAGVLDPDGTAYSMVQDLL